MRKSTKTNTGATKANKTGALMLKNQSGTVIAYLNMFDNNMSLLSLSKTSKKFCGVEDFAQLSTDEQSRLLTAVASVETYVEQPTEEVAPF